MHYPAPVWEPLSKEVLSVAQDPVPQGSIKCGVECSKRPDCGAFKYDPAGIGYTLTLTLPLENLLIPIDVSGKCTLASVRDYYCPSIILIQFSFILLFMQFLCLQNLPFNISKTGAFTKVERVTSCKVAGRYKIQNVCMENSLQLSV